MRLFDELLIKEYEQLQKYMEETRLRQKAAPEGKLRVSQNGKYTQYYYVTEVNKRGSYIAREQERFVRQLAQKSYDKKLMEWMKNRAYQLEQLINENKKGGMKQIYDKETKIRQSLITPVEPMWEQRVATWMKQPYKGKEFLEEAPMIITERGERVRSKSEKIMADYFYRRGIAYKYECPLYLKGVGTVYPDFTFLSPRTYEEIYWEHNGIMDDPIYARRAVKKIQSYEDNGIFPGDRLILTYETEKTILTTAKIEQLTNRYLVI